MWRKKEENSGEKKEVSSKEETACKERKRCESTKDQMWHHLRKYRCKRTGGLGARLWLWSYFLIIYPFLRKPVLNICVVVDPNRSPMGRSTPSTRLLDWRSRLYLTVDLLISDLLDWSLGLLTFIYFLYRQILNIPAFHTTVDKRISITTNKNRWGRRIKGEKMKIVDYQGLGPMPQTFGSHSSRR